MAAMERMLINATQPEEIRVAMTKNNHLYDLDIECSTEIKKKGNIYKAIVTRIEPSLDAVFVEYGSKRQGFLPIKEIAPEYFNKARELDEKLPITSYIREKQEILIQVDKEERGTKGAALTTFITLAGGYLVLMPNSPRSGGISRRIEGDDRDELKETLHSLNMTEDMGVIIRTAGVGKSQDELQSDLDMLCNQWQAIKQAAQQQLAPCLIHQEGDVIIRSIRDNLRKSIGEIIIDDQVAYVKAKQFIELVKPDFLPNLKRYNSTIPLFNFYQIESQIETAYQRQVMLPSGGALVIDRTEALVSIDINSAKATGGSDIETTALNTNLEAADEIARQLRLRDLGGLVVIDFIDMSSNKNQRDVENRLKEALKADRARIQIGRISRFGLLEMSRQRLRLSLGETAQDVCPRCEGRGVVRNIQSRGLSIIRLVEEEALKEKVNEVQVQVPVEMATFLMNEKRDFLLNIEKRHHVHVVVIANPYMHCPQYQILRIKEDPLGKNKKPSYSLVQQPDLVLTRASDELKTQDEPIVKALGNHAHTKNKASILKRLWDGIFGDDENSKRKPQSTTAHHEISSQNMQNKKPMDNRRAGGSQSSNRKRPVSGNAAQRNTSAQPRKKPAPRQQNSNQGVKKPTAQANKE